MRSMRIELLLMCCFYIKPFLFQLHQMLLFKNFLDDCSTILSRLCSEDPCLIFMFGIRIRIGPWLHLMSRLRIHYSVYHCPFYPCNKNARANSIRIHMDHNATLMQNDTKFASVCCFQQRENFMCRKCNLQQSNSNTEIDWAKIHEIKNIKKKKKIINGSFESGRRGRISFSWFFLHHKFNWIY